MVRGRAHEQDVPAVADEAGQPQRCARPAPPRPTSNRRQHAVLSQDARPATTPKHPADAVDTRASKQGYRSGASVTLSSFSCPRYSEGSKRC